MEGRVRGVQWRPLLGIPSKLPQGAAWAPGAAGSDLGGGSVATGWLGQSMPHPASWSSGEPFQGLTRE